VLVLLFVSFVQVTANKKELGVAFKKDAKTIADALEALPEDEADCLRKTLESGNICHHCSMSMIILLSNDSLLTINDLFHLLYLCVSIVLFVLRLFPSLQTAYEHA
jgi:hypothetical protein